MRGRKDTKFIVLVRQSLESLKAADRARDRAVRRLDRAVAREGKSLARALIPALILRRKELGLTPTEVARRMQIRSPSLCRLGARRERQNPSLQTLVRYAAAVGVTLQVSPLPGDWRVPPPTL